VAFRFVRALFPSLFRGEKTFAKMTQRPDLGDCSAHRFLAQEGDNQCASQPSSIEAWPTQNRLRLGPALSQLTVDQQRPWSAAAIHRFGSNRRKPHVTRCRVHWYFDNGPEICEHLVKIQFRGCVRQPMILRTEYSVLSTIRFVPSPSPARLCRT
jgi:hypothetical protein